MALPVDGGQIIHTGRVTPVGAKGLPRPHVMAEGFEFALTPGGRGENAGSKSAPPFDKIRMSLTGTDFVIASVAWQSRRRSNGGSPTCVQPHRDCHVATLLAMTEWVRMSRTSGASKAAEAFRQAWEERGKLVGCAIRKARRGGSNCSDLRGSADYWAHCGGATEHGISTANRFRPLKREQLRAAGVCSLGMIGWCILLVGLVRLRVSLVAKFILVRVI